MNFLCDVHISIKFAKFIELKGYNCIHVNTILDSWFTKDQDISKFVDQEGMILISKDIDFKNSHFVKNTPRKLVKINLGNISNDDLIAIFDNILPQIGSTFLNNDSFIIEVGKDATSITCR